MLCLQSKIRLKSCLFVGRNQEFVTSFHVTNLGGQFFLMSIIICLFQADQQAKCRKNDVRFGW